MKQIPFLLLITLGMVACGLSSPPKPAPVVEVTPAPVIEAAPIQEVVKVVAPDCKCEVCKCVDCVCEPEKKVEHPVSTVVKPPAQPVARTTFGQQYSSCGPNGCGPTRSFRIFRGRL